AIRQCKKTLYNYTKDRVKLFHENFEGFRNRLALEKVAKVDGILYDIGVSQHQINEVRRGFSFMNDSFLDMRMNKAHDTTASDIVNNYKVEDLIDIFYKYGEERFSKKIAQNIEKQRQISQIETTKELADIVEKSVTKGSKKDIIKSQARIFQAIRIELNNELEVLQTSLIDAISMLNPGGRLLVISWHSLEDRIVKDTFKRNLGKCECLPTAMKCVCGAKRRLKLITKKAIIPSEYEISKNSNARSAKLRVAERV
ncbi:MAG: 16S rRNA (cytosine(1402)-N(4))-methyltransferase RsmH, partial [Candidatus Cloacimonetes bacterium]|nr:16S rRNA (cytosine(1402)-N(4))-methyltransferase RsmH [Candidatus Cloacimonadota bacterium]